LETPFNFADFVNTSRKYRRFHIGLDSREYTGQPYTLPVKTSNFVVTPGSADIELNACT